jgi:hypothetical protein
LFASPRQYTENEIEAIAEFDRTQFLALFRRDDDPAGKVSRASMPLKHPVTFMLCSRFTFY